MNREGGFGLEVSKGFVAKILLALLGFVGSIVFARVLGPKAYGAFHVVVAVAGVLDNPVSGFGEACKKRISESDRDSGEILVAGTIVAAAAGLIALVIAFTVGLRLSLLDVENGVFYVGVLFFGLVGFKVLHPMVAGRGAFGTAVLWDTLRSVLTLPAQLVLVLLGWGVSGMIYGLILASLATSALMGLALVSDTTARRPSKETLSDLWTYARFSIPSRFIGTAYGQVDVLLLSAVIGSAAAGQYKIALQLTLPGVMLSMVMSSGLFAEVSSRLSQEEDVEGTIENNVAFASLFAIPIFFGALAMPMSIVVTVFGAEYVHAAPLLVGLALYQLMNTQAMQASSILSGYDRPDLRLYIMSATLILNIALGSILVFRIGTIGIVLATVVAETARYGLLVYYARNHVKYDIFPRTLAYQFLAAGGMFLIVEGLHRLFGVRSWIDLLLIVGVGATVYAGALLGLSDVFLHTGKSIFADARERYL